MADFIYYDFEDFRLDVVNEQLLKDNQPIALTQKAYQILLILVENAGQLVKKDHIINEVWQDSFVEDANLTQQIYVLRKTLGNDKNGKPFIETLPKKGYSFVGEINKISVSQNPLDEISLSPEDNQLDKTSDDLNVEKEYNYPNNNYPKAVKSFPNNSTVQTKNRSFSKYLLPIFAIIILFGLAFWFYQKFQPVKETDIKSIAVLPFKTVGEENDNSKIGFGVADAIITNLSKLQKLPVRSMNAVFQYTDKQIDPINAGKNLGVDAVLEGTVQRDGERIRVSARLIKISDSSTIWAETFDDKFTDIFTLQDSISTKVAKSILVNLSKSQEQQILTHDTNNPEAFQFYQLGVYFLNTKTKDGLEKAVLYFQKAIELDNNFALAHAMLSDTYNWIDGYGFENDHQELLNKSESAAKKALAIDDNLAEAHIALAYVQLSKYKDHNAGKISIEHAVQLSPYNATARFHYGWNLLGDRKLNEAFEQIKLAQEYDPLSSEKNLAVCSLLIYKKDYPQALNFCKKSTELQPAMPYANIQLANTLFLNNRTAEAVNLLKVESQSETNKYDALGNLAYIYAKTGKTKEAEEIYKQLKKAPENYSRFGDLAVIGFILGKKDEALINYKKMIETAPLFPTNLIFDPFWEDIFKDDDFKKLIPQSNNKD